MRRVESSTSAHDIPLAPWESAGLRPRGSETHDLQRKNKGSRMVSARRLINIQEASEYVGLSVHTLYTMVSQRRIPFVKIGRLTKFDVGLLEAWIKKNTVMPMVSKPEKTS